MGIPVLIMGASGSGKSTSMRNLNPDEVGVFNVAKKPLPFRGKLPTVNTSDPDIISQHIAKNSRKCYVVDDSQYIMAFYLLSKAKEVGYVKFTECALKFYNLIDTIIQHTTDDTIVYLLHHTERSEDGYLKAKTSGKMLDNQLTLEGLFSIVLMAETDGKEHYFVTQSNGLTTAKSPMEMFEPKIPNDLKMVDTAIREYYGFSENKEE